MPFRIRPDGTIEVDSSAELLDVMRVRTQLGQAEKTVVPHAPQGQTPNGRHGERPQNPVAESSSNRDSGFRALYTQAAEQPQQQKLLKAILRPKGLTDSQLRAELGLSSNVALRGLMIGLVRRASNRGLPNPIHREMTRTDGGRKRAYHYSAASAFRRAMQGVKLDDEPTV
jgi:hypothetical protein